MIGASANPAKGGCFIRNNFGYLIDDPDTGVIGLYPELIVGLIRDPQFGPCVMCGFGGLFKEISVNPLIVSEGKPIAVDATIIMDE